MARRHTLAILAISCHSGDPFDFSVVENNPGLLPPDADAGSKPKRPAPVITDIGSDPASRHGDAEPLVTVPMDASSADADSSSGTCVSVGGCESESCDAGSCACDAGLCPAQRASLGTPCEGASECASDFCVAGICCDAACDGACQDCGPNGVCDQFPGTDPLCEPATCTLDECHVATTPIGFGTPPIERACVGFGRCAGPESCSVYKALPATPCGDAGALCSTEGECTTDYQIPPLGPTQLCPALDSALVEARANLDADFVDCWTGPSWELGSTFANGGMTMGTAGENSRILTSYSYWGSVKTQAYTSDGVLIPGCVVVDPATDWQGVVVSFDDDTCRNAAFVRVTAHESVGADL